MKATYKGPHGLTVEFKDSDVINMDEFEPNGYYDKAFLFYHEFGTVCIVFAPDEHDALDMAADHDSDPLKTYRVPEKDYVSLSESERDKLDYLGNASEPFRLGDYFGMVQLPVPKLSFVACWNAQLSPEDQVEIAKQNLEDAKDAENRDYFASQINKY